MKTDSKYLLAILLVSFLLNIWGIHWGLPGRWHPDEITMRAENMVGNMSLDPHKYAYGSFHYYPVMALAVLPVKLTNQGLYRLGLTKEKHFFFNRTTQENIIVILSRLITVLLGTGIVLLVYLLANVLFDHRAALFSASLLAVTMGFVNICHFASTDIPSIFWFTLSCLMCAYVFVYGHSRWYVLSGLFSGFAAAVKYVGGISLFTLTLAHILKNDRSNKSFFLGILMALIGFIAGNPVVILSFFEFTNNFFRALTFGSLRAAHTARAFLPFIFDLMNTMGIPLFLLSLCGIFYSFISLTSKECRSKILLIWSMFIPFYLIVGSKNVSTLRYTVYIVPFLLILTGKMIKDLTGLKSQILKTTSAVLFGIVISYSLVYTVAADMKFTNDSRYLALNWLTKNVKEGSIIEVTSYAPNISNDRYVVVERPHDYKISQTVLLAEESSKYRFALGIISELETLLDRVGLREKKSYVTWYEKNLKEYESATLNFDPSVKGLESRKPDYLIISDFYYARHLVDKNTNEGKFFDALLSGKTRYEQVVEFKYRLLPWIDPEVEFVNPHISIFARK